MYATYKNVVVWFQLCDFEVKEKQFYVAEVLVQVPGTGGQR
jgi:hypothetical protein